MIGFSRVDWGLVVGERKLLEEELILLFFFYNLQSQGKFTSRGGLWFLYSKWFHSVLGYEIKKIYFFFNPLILAGLVEEDSTWGSL